MTGGLLYKYQIGPRPTRKSIDRSPRPDSFHVIQHANRIGQATTTQGTSVMIRRILVSTLSRDRRPHFPNAVVRGPRGSRPITLGAAALALSTALGSVYLDSDAFGNKEGTVGAFYPILIVIFLTQSNPDQLNRLRQSNSQLPCVYRPREPFRNLR